MTILCSLLVVALISVTAIAFWRELVHKVVVADLLDRVMARSYGEYVAGHTPAPKPRRRAPLTDEEMAMLEQKEKAS